MERKKRERATRSGRSPAEGSGPSDPVPSLSDLRTLLPGMIALFTGARSRDEVMDIAAKCSRFGSDLIDPEKSFQRFPHAGFEAGKECSSR